MIETKKRTRVELLDNYIKKILPQLAVIYYPNLNKEYQLSLKNKGYYRPPTSKMVFDEIVIMHNTKDGVMGSLPHYLYPRRTEEDSRSHIKDAEKLIEIFNNRIETKNNSFIEIEDGHGTVFDLLIKIKGYYIFFNHTTLSIQQIKKKGGTEKWDKIIKNTKVISLNIDKILNKEKKALC
ncbi:MAG: hypothetical protein U9Q66_01070 [Patescibacteria group bacterium]|nr:hypothetical protein [Patescibacteria group bacterium]